jgi:hypothetical protein
LPADDDLLGSAPGAMLDLGAAHVMTDNSMPTRSTASDEAIEHTVIVSADGTRTR